MSFLSKDKVKDEATKTWSNLKTAVGRTKQKILVAAGHSDQTVDVQYNQWKERTLEYHKQMLALCKSLSHYSDSVKQMTAAQKALATTLEEFYAEKVALTDAAQSYKQATDKCDEFGAAMGEHIKQYCIQPTSGYLQQFIVLKDNIDHRTDVRTDMDRYGRELQQLKEKNDQLKIHKAEAKYNEAKAKYDALNDTLIQEMNALWEDRIRFLDLLFANMMYAETDILYKPSTTALHAMLSSVARVDRRLAQSHLPVITPEEKSSFKYSGTSNSIFTPSTGSVLVSTTVASTSGSASTTSSSAGSQMSGSATPATTPTTTAPSPAKPVAHPSVATKKAIGMFEFKATEDNELSFRVNDIVTILKMEGDWWMAELNGKTGLIPANYVKLQ